MLSRRQRTILERLRANLERQLRVLEQMVAFWMRSGAWARAVHDEQHAAFVADLMAQVNNLLARSDDYRA